MAENSTKKRETDFTNGPVLGPLVRFMGPILAALMIQSLYSAVDLMIVGQFGTAVNVSGVSVGGSLTFAVQSFITSLAMGTTILLGQYIGEGRRKDASRVVGTSILLFAGIAVAVTVLLFLFAGSGLSLLQTPAEAMGEGTVYVRICSVGMIFIVAYNVMGSIFRGIGDSKTPLIAVGIACAVNIAGDLLLVGVFHMAAAGAAIATVVAQGISVWIAVSIAGKRGLPFDLKWKELHFERALALQVFKLGIPLALQSLVVSGSFLILQGILNSLGLIASAGIGVAGRLVTFIMLFPDAAVQALSAFVAHNVGARRLHRAKKALLHCIWMNLAFSCLMSILSYFNGTVLTGIFTSDPAVMVAAAEYLKAYAVDCFLCSFLFSFLGYFNGCGRTTLTMLQGLLGVVVRITSAFILKGLSESLFVIGLATPISTVMQNLLCTIYYFATDKTITRQYESEELPE
ncbi:MAG: MATE family efflux transporter [Parasporobacterium sp.]|nr:MATE family efflux transporter [Parasporobacterium sp.]